MESVKIFISYVRNSSQDYKSLQLLKTHLASLENYGDIEVWYGGVEKAIEDEEHQILTHLYKADMFLILVSPDYFNSGYCNQYELSCIHERYEDGSAILIPIIANPCRWKSNKLLADLQPLPRNGRAINTSSNVAMRDAILASIVEDIAKMVHQLLDGETNLNLPELVPRGRLRFEHDSVRELLAKDMLPLRISRQPNHRSSVAISLAVPQREQSLWKPPMNAQRSSVTSSAKQSKARATRGKKKQEEHLLAREAVASTVKPLPRKRGEEPITISFGELLHNWFEDAKSEYRAFFHTELIWFLIVTCFFDAGFLALFVTDRLKLPLIFPIGSFILFIIGIFNASNLLAFLLAAVYGIFWGKVFQMLYSWSPLTALIVGGCILLFHFFLFRNHPWLYIKRRKRRWWKLW